jgi:hypothetical protein
VLIKQVFGILPALSVERGLDCHCLLPVGCWLLAVGCWLLSSASRLLAIGYCLLSVVYCLLAVVYSPFPYLGRSRITQIGGGGAKRKTGRGNTETHSSWKTGGIRQFPYLRRFRVTQIGGGARLRPFSLNTEKGSTGYCLLAIGYWLLSIGYCLWSMVY